MAITPTTELAAKIRDACGENPYLCYQCQKCSLGCATAHAMTYRPAQIMRAVRLVVDSGLHQERRTREQAIDYMLANTGMPEGEVVSEVERYIVRLRPHLRSVAIGIAVIA